MLNFDLCTETERREAAMIERRRAQDELRMKRIFGPKAKIFIDQEALKEQIEEKNKRQHEERVKDRLFEEQTRQFAMIAKELTEKEALERKKNMRELNEFRMTFQKKEDRREADIDMAKGDPSRISDDDPRCGLSSMQKFDGEDQYSQERRKIQMEQTRAWLDQQMDEKERADRERHEAEEAYRAATTARDQQARELEHLERECRHKLSLACMDYNKALADERDRLSKQFKREEQQDMLAHNYNVMMSDMMLESSSAATPGEKRQEDKAKGLSRADRVALLEEQKLLAKEARARRELEKRREKEFDEYTNGLQMTVAAMDADIARKKKELLRTIAEENMRMSKEHQSQEQFLKKVVYTNRPSEAYYDQFNNTAR